MIIRTRGIVFSSTRYGESSVIARIYTEELGLRSFIVRGVHKKKSKNPSSLLQHLSLVELVARVKEKSEVQNLSELRLDQPFQSISSNIYKSAQVLFINELLIKSIREQEENRELFNFIHSSLLLLDTRTDKTPDFHLQFAISLTRFLGFYPAGNFSEDKTFFDLHAGSFETTRPLHDYYIEEYEAEDFSGLLQSNYNYRNKHLTIQKRKRLLQIIIDYYRLHIDSFGTFKSLDVLETIFN